MNKQKLSRLGILILFLSLFIFFISCSRSHNGQITILHTNDMHAQYVPMPATWIKTTPRPQIGGMVALEYFIRHERAKYPHALLLDAGDIMTGTPISKINVDGALGGGFVEMMNLIGYNAMTIGNHEFDEGQDNLQKLIGLAKFDVVSANLFANDRLIAPKPYAIYKVGSIRVGVIGLVLKDLFGVASKKNLEGVRVDDPVATAQKYIDRIDPQTDLIVLLTHEGIEPDIHLAKKIRNADIIIGGHSHTRLTKAKTVNRVIIVQTGSKTTNLGRLIVDVQADTVAHFDYKLIPTFVDSVKDPNPEMQKMVDTFKKQIDQEYGKVIGTLHRDWVKNNREESNIGNYIADVMRTTVHTDFAVLNSGGIRKNLPAGPITKLDIIEILPFSNYLVKFTCTGEQLLTLIKENAQAAIDHSHGILQVSGLKYTYRVGANNKAFILSARINGKKIDPKATYTGASVDFVVFGQTQKYFGFEPTNVETTGYLISDVLMDYIASHPDVNAKVEGRIRRVR